MAEILCPTCGRPNPDDHSFCDFCGSPLKDLETFRPDHADLRDEFLDSAAGPEDQDESSRLDSLFSEPEADEGLPASGPPDPSRDPFDLDEIFPAFEQDTDRSASQEPAPRDISQERLQLNDFEDVPEPSGEQTPEAGFSEPPAERDPLDFEDFRSSWENEGIQSQDDSAAPDTPPDDWLEKLSQEADQDSFPPAASYPPESQPESFPAAEEWLGSDQPADELPPQWPAPKAGGSGEEDWEEPEPSFDSVGFEDDSGWLDMLQEPGEREEFPADSEPASEQKKPQTDWLERIKRLNKSAEFVEEDSSFPDWLSVSEKAAEQKAPEAQPEEPEAEPSASPVPDWLKLDGDDEMLNEFLRRKDLTNEEYKPQIKRSTDELEALPESYGAPDEIEDDSQPKKFPSWAEGESPPEEVPQGLKFLAGMDQDGFPQKVVDPFQGEDDYLDDLFSDELPDWLTTATAEEEVLPFAEEISLGELPGWVEAMRPVVESSDASGLSDDEDYIENYGPLAGIPSVLPAEADILQDPAKEAKKPLDLVASKTQIENVNLLKRLIGTESKAKPIQKPAPVHTQRVLRWLIAIILLITTTGTIIFGGTFENPTPLASVSPNTGYGALFLEIENLYDEQPVLVAFDYQPAASGELHTAAAGVVDHLMAQGTYLTLLSTEPTGPALAEYFLTNTQSSHNYLHTQQYINLGYLPGESAGLLSFIVAPKKIIPLAFDGSNAWDAPPLQGVDSIQDFAMIMVITDDPNTAKTWIEQVGTVLEDIPLTMVVSAQVEPLIQPYFRASPQLLSGYVSGVIDSINYEGLLERPNLAHQRWLPFNIGIIITVGTIFIGGLANGVMSLFSRHRIRRIEESI